MFPGTWFKVLGKVLEELFPWIEFALSIVNFFGIRKLLKK